MSKKEDRLLVGIVAVLVLVALANAAVVFSLNSGISSKIEAAKPPALELIKIVPDCSECFNIDNAVNFIKSQYDVEIISEKSLAADSAEAELLISKYGIERLPTLLVKGETSKNEEMKQFFDTVGTQKDDYVILTAIPPVYIETATGRAVGKVDLINIIDGSCTSCYDVSVWKQILASNPFYVYVSGENSYGVDSEQGKSYLSKYNITKVPAVILSPDASVYGELKSAWTGFPVGTIESDGWFVFRNMQALRNITYKDLETGNITTV